MEYPLPQDRVNEAYTDPLSDLDERTRQLFQRRYLPNLQQAVSIWKNALPILKENSAKRIAASREFKEFLDKLDKVQARQSGTLVNAVDERIEIGMDDLQMQEAVYILNDMIQIKEGARGQESALILPTGSD